MQSAPSVTYIIHETGASVNHFSESLSHFFILISEYETGFDLQQKERGDNEKISDDSGRIYRHSVSHHRRSGKVSGTCSRAGFPACGNGGNTDRNAAAKPAASLCRSYRMLDITSGKVAEISVRDYVIGAVCAEMPATFEPEALKAQAVAAHTYAERQHLLEQEQPTPELCGADFSNDSSQYQACFTENQARQYYGDSFQTSYAKICDAVDEVLPYVLESGGSPIVAAFCSMSAGKTESAENVWGASVPYLVSVDSSADTTAPRYLETADFTAQELQTQLAGLLPDADWDTAPADWFHIVSTTDAGTVQTLTVCGQTCTGQEVRDALALRSAAFTVACADGKFTFTTRGFGHGVGMSQYGANAMAKDGADWREILMHYYPETEIVSFSE